VFLIGHWQDSLEFFSQKAGGALKGVHFLTSHFLPNLERVNWKDLVLYDQPVEAALRVQAVGYSLAWFGLCVCLATLIFRKKDVG
jgi:hypothetical protein